MKLNEKQHQIIAKASIQELIKQLDLELYDGTEKTRHDISTRVQSWITKLQVTDHKPRIMSIEPSANPFSEKSDWIQNQKAVHGRDWVPF